jgi:hypothetical protein
LGGSASLGPHVQRVPNRGSGTIFFDEGLLAPAEVDQRLDDAGTMAQLCFVRQVCLLRRHPRPCGMPILINVAVILEIECDSGNRELRNLMWAGSGVWNQQGAWNREWKPAAKPEIAAKHSEATSRSNVPCAER